MVVSIQYVAIYVPFNLFILGKVYGSGGVSPPSHLIAGEPPASSILIKVSSQHHCTPVIPRSVKHDACPEPLKKA